MIFNHKQALISCTLILQSKNFEVITKDRCTRIIDDLNEHQPDVILMDN